MEKMVSKRDVIICRGIWYLLILLSLFGLSISLNLLWPPKEYSCESSSSRSRFLRDGAVSVTTFYAVTLIRYFFFTDPPSPCYLELTTKKQRFFQHVISTTPLIATQALLTFLGWANDFVLTMPLFTISLFTGGIGLIQLSDKARMETKHAYLTLFLGWFCCLCASYIGLYGEDHWGVVIFLLALWVGLLTSLSSYNFEHKVFRLPT